LSVLATTGFPPPGTATVVNLLVASSAFVAGEQKNNVPRRARAEPACEIVMGDILDGVRKVSRGGRTDAAPYSNGDANSSSSSSESDSRTVTRTGIRPYRCWAIPCIEHQPGPQLATPDSRWKIMLHSRSISPLSMSSGGLRPSKASFRSVEPGRDRFLRHDLGQPAAEPGEFLGPSQPRLAHRLAALPVGDRALGELGEPGEELAAESEPAPDRDGNDRSPSTTSRTLGSWSVP
jgi:hypothetical protein